METGRKNMEMKTQNLTELTAIARSIGWGAGEILQKFYRGENVDISNEKGSPLTAADLAVNEYILNNLKAVCDLEEFGFLSEETYKTETDKSSLKQPFVWIIDPLDGTRDFIDKTGEYAIHIALVSEQRPLLSVVVCPEMDKLYFASLGQGAFVENKQGKIEQIQVTNRENIADLAIVVSRTHRDDRFNNLLAKLPCKNQKYVGSVGCKIAAIVDGNADVYISLSGKSAPKDWDMCAPELILTEAGGKFTHADGNPLKYNTGDVNQWGCLIASNGNFHDHLCEIINQELN
jgi:3'(2'), 5'-bisphosphate nucleotidase